ncbi:hypothetical protein ACZ75_11285 [Massilia sp. NR 4-1]|nr:hypothetical protein ACZ75_11285 [Massilia sp. NR 4-1]
MKNGLPLTAKELEAALVSNPTAAQVVNSFADSQISTQFYSGSNELVIEKVFSTLFGRTPDAGEKAKWLAKLNGGEVSRRYLPLAILNSAAGSDKDLLAKKAALAAAYIAASSAPPQTIELWEQETSRALLATVELEADETLFTPLAKAAVRRFETEAFAPILPPPVGTIYGFSSYKFLPGSVLMCATKARKSRLVDYLVSAKAVAISEAAGLAKQKFSIWHEDCVSINNGRSFAFDDGGNATLTIGTSIAKFTADQVSQALQGQAIADATFRRSVKFQAYSIAKADGSKAYLLVERAVGEGGSTEFLTAWIQK